MNLKELLRGVAVRDATVPELKISGISYDSRSTQPGDLFVAVVGYQTDGHRYIADAAARGAAAVLCQTPPEQADIPCVCVADSRAALAAVSAAFFGHPAERMTLIGVTGTNGKTTSTLLIKHVLEQTLEPGAKVGLIGTNGNMIGAKTLPSERTTPESYELHRLFREMADAGCTHVVMEVSSHALAEGRTAGLHFAVGMFTNLTEDHLDFHGTMENYAAEKAKLFAQCDAAVVNLDDAWMPYFLSRMQIPVRTYSIRSDAASLVAKDIQLLPERVRFCAVTLGEIARVELAVPGRFSVYNALDVLSCCMQLGVGLNAAAAALRSAKGVKGRMEPVPTDGDYTILIDYAHTPDALENVLKTVRESKPRRLVVLFGCGGDRDRQKRPIMGEIATRLADFSIITSDNPRTEEPEAIIRDILGGVTVKKRRYTVIPDRRAAIAYAIKRHRAGDVIVLAGKGHETYQEVGHVKYPMDEREIVAELQKKRKETE
ncbi:MAG: UDP-N-acetylmuramoyl-L-alanyl-D-glutamate--2,6-diaminopimelate ligase [Oscillospiraceae bacterium]|nr:UDP-N-acetylmuramoyl-L-alanyl-D-glutamate--2,6-diaminopimelate ligase [Oscillospiraceae bacterium]